MDEERVERADCPLKKGDRLWRLLTGMGDDGDPKLGHVHFEKTDKGDYMARCAHFHGDAWVIYGDRTFKNRGGLIVFLPKRYVPLDDNLLCFVVTGTSKNGKSVFVRPEPGATMQEYREAALGKEKANETAIEACP